MSRKTFEIATEPHEAVVGDYVFKFPPELASKDMLGPYKDLMAAYGSNPENLDPSKATATPADIERTATVMEAVLQVIRTLLLPESRELFDSVTLPDRVVGDIFRWIMETYGQRPTGPSSDSSQSPSNNGAASTESSEPKEPQTLSTGASPDSSTP